MRWLCSLVYLWDSQQWKWGCLWLFCLSLGPFSSYCVTLSNLGMSICASSFCTLLFCVQLVSLGELLFPWKEMEEEWIWWRGEVRGCGRIGRTGNCSWDALCERRIQKKYYHGDNSSDIPGGILGQHNLLVPPFCKWIHLRPFISSILHFFIVREARLVPGNGALSLSRECGSKEVILIEFLLFLAHP